MRNVISRVWWSVLGMAVVAVALLHHEGAFSGNPPVNRWGADYFPNVELTTQHGTKVRLYDDLLTINPSPLVALNRLVAVWKVRGLAEAERELRALEETPPLRAYYLLPASKGRLLAARGEHDAARRAYDAALALPCSQPEKRLLQRLRDRAGGPFIDTPVQLPPLM